MRGKFFFVQELHRMRSDHGQLEFGCQLRGLPQQIFLSRVTVTLDFDIEVTMENLRPARRAPFRQRSITIFKRTADIPGLKPRQSD